MCNKATNSLDDSDYKSSLDIICEGFLIYNKMNNDKNTIIIENSDYNVFSSILASIVLPIKEIPNHLRFYYCKQKDRVTEPFPIFIHDENYAYYPACKESISIVDEKNNCINELDLEEICNRSSTDYKKRINVRANDVSALKLEEISLISECFSFYDDINKDNNFIDFYTLFMQENIQNHEREVVYLNLFLFCYIFKIDYDFPDEHYNFHTSISLQDIRTIKKIIFNCFTDLQRGRTVSEFYKQLITENYDTKIISFFSSFIRSLQNYFNNSSENQREVIETLIEKINKA